MHLAHSGSAQWCSHMGHPWWKTTVHFCHGGLLCSFAPTTIASTNCSKMAIFSSSFPPNYQLQPMSRMMGTPLILLTSVTHAFQVERPMRSMIGVPIILCMWLQLVMGRNGHDPIVILIGIKISKIL